MNYLKASKRNIFLFLHTNTGQVLFEVILAVALFGFLAVMLAGAVTSSFNSLEQGGEWTAANALAQEGVEGVRSIQSRAWNENIYTVSAVLINAGEWIFSGEGTTETIGQFTRTISFDDVCRDGTHDIVLCPGVYTDVHSKQLNVGVAWMNALGVTNLAERITYITNWDSRDWIEDTTVDFSDGSFTSTLVSPILGDADGAILLIPG